MAAQLHGYTVMQPTLWVNAVLRLYGYATHFVSLYELCAPHGYKDDPLHGCMVMWLTLWVYSHIATLLCGLLWFYMDMQLWLYSYAACFVNVCSYVIM